jgi:NAD(P)-dependent dehydrogenase (short-subunit alcohol dehydrogenase family)
MIVIDKETRDRVAVVTGASRGIGLATARQLAALGTHIVLVARNIEVIQQIVTSIEADGGQACAVGADVSRPEDLDSVVTLVAERFGYLDVLINNAGVLNKAARSEALGMPSWNDTISVNLTAPFYLASRLKHLMRRDGVVINVSSTAAAYPSVGLAPYCVSKAGLDMLTRVLALEWARDGIRVVGVAPGKVDTELGAPVLRYTEARRTSYNPLDRVGGPEEVAELIVFLASDRAGFITGCTYVIDGGELLLASR